MGAPANVLTIIVEYVVILGLTALAVHGVRAYGFRKDEQLRASGRRLWGGVMMFPLMVASFFTPVAKWAIHPTPIIWVLPTLTATVVLAGTAKRKGLRRGGIAFGAWLLLAFAISELGVVLALHL